METIKSIDYRFKFLYVIGILTVVIGHCGLGVSLFYDWFPPYSFQIALFLFCSGYFYKDSNLKNVTKYISHKFKTLIIPLYLWNFFYSLLSLGLKKVGFTFGERISFTSLFIMPITNGHQFYFNLGGWFIIPLFMIQIFNILVRKFIKVIGVGLNEWVYFGGYLALGFLGVYLSNSGYSDENGLVFMRFLCMIPFYGLGILYKRRLEKWDTIPNILYFSIIMFLQLMIITHYGAGLSYTLAWCNDLPNNVLSIYVQSFVAIMFWLRIATIMQPIVKDSKYIKLIAENTYSIMINQFLGFLLVKSIFAILHCYTTFCKDFHMDEFFGNIWYYYLPQDRTQWYLVYGVAGIVLPILMQTFINNVKNRFVIWKQA